MPGAGLYFPKLILAGERDEEHAEDRFGVPVAGPAFGPAFQRIENGVERNDALFLKGNFLTLCKDVLNARVTAAALHAEGGMAVLAEHFESHQPAGLPEAVDQFEHAARRAPHHVGPEV